ncbi:MAG: GIY-YIG nuclease family protein [Nitrospinota bacterium]|nr:GIY-YIG nuclease family protein [Nitrospinota bacterium]
MKYFYVYILASKSSVLYIGVTNNLERRMYEHKKKITKGFTSKYNVNRLVYYEVCSTIKDAIAREKQLKAGSRSKKVELIESDNREWRDLSEEW